MVVAMLAACSKSNDNEPAASGSSGASGSPSAGSSESTSPSPSESSAPLRDGKFDPPVTVTTWGYYSNTYKFADGQSIDKNTALDWAKEKLGIEFKYLWTSPWENDAALTKMRLSLSSGEKLPDVVYVSVDAKGRAIIADLIETGQFMDVSELFDKHASDALKGILDNHPELWQFASKDGKKYGIPKTHDPYANAPLMYIREDWLKNVGMKTPTTIAELDAVMDAFANKDPEKDGKKNTFGVSLGTKNTWLEGFNGTGWIFGAYGTVPTYWIKGADGKLQYGSVQPGAREALLKLNEWYKKGYIDPEFATKDATKAAESVTAGKTGILTGPYWMPIWPLPDLVKNVPEAVMAPAVLPAGPNGKPGFNEGDSLLGVFLVNKDMKNPEALMVYLNKMLQAGTREKGSDVEFGFVEGYDYKLVDGKPVADQVNRVDAILPGNGAMMVPERNVESLAYLSTGAEPRNMFDQGNVSAQPAHLPGAIMQKQFPFGIVNEFKGATTPTMETKWEALTKMETEVFTKIVYGREPIEAFDEFVKKWKSSGGDQITQEVNDWYAATGQK